MKLTLLIIVLLLPISAQKARLVIASGAKDSATAANKLEELDLKLSSYDFGNEHFPILVHSDTIQGLNKGFWITVAALTKHQ